MKVAAVKAPGGLDKLAIETRADPAPKAGEVLVRIHASSLNYHDYAVAAGMIKTPDGRIPMSDGAGEVVAVGEGVKKFKVGDKALSTFFPNWDAGGPSPSGWWACLARRGRFRRRVGGHAGEHVHAPAEGLVLRRGRHPALRGPDRLARAGGGSPDQAGRYRADPGHRGRLDLRPAAGQGDGGHRRGDIVLGEKLERLKGLGADHLINYKEDPNWGQAAAAWTGGRGVDAVVEIGGAGNHEPVDLRLRSSAAIFR